MEVAFFLNIAFAILEAAGGLITGSVAIISDAFHDFCDAMSIGIACRLEKKSKKRPDSTHTYGYSRYSVLGAFITNCILVVGSLAVMYNGALKVVHPTAVYTDGMIIFAVFGIVANTAAVYLTKGGNSLNQRAVNLHMGEDVLCWVAILIGAVAIKLTGFVVIDAILSFGVGLYILINAALSFGEITDLFMEKTPKDLSVKAVTERLLCIAEVIDVHHVHIRSIDGIANSATMHIVSNEKDLRRLKCRIKQELAEMGILHTTLEFESYDEMQRESGEISAIKESSCV